MRYNHPMTTEERLARAERDIDKIWDHLAPLGGVPASLARIEKTGTETRDMVNQMQIDLAGKRSAVECPVLHEKLMGQTIDRIDARETRDTRDGRHRYSDDWKYWAKLVAALLVTAATAWFGRGVIG